jgi:hypothetical protein
VKTITLMKLEIMKMMHEVTFYNNVTVYAVAGASTPLRARYPWFFGFE